MAKLTRSVLVVDDDERLLYLIVSVLKVNRFDSTGATSATEAHKLLETKNFDIMVVDWMMPNVSGVEFVKSVRISETHASEIPALMLTAVGDINSKIAGFEAGVDDYLTKPFEERELVARLNAILSRSHTHRNHSNILKLGNCKFDLISGELTRGTSAIRLSTMELTLLRALCRKPNQPYARRELAQKFAFGVSERTIDVQIARLRQKIGDDAKTPRVIKTIRHVGYAVWIL
ncbi:MAG: response regulator transcription factor [Holosporales bacterium]|nr:response regulator transcription factor [Holosporales bacterium]